MKFTPIFTALAVLLLLSVVPVDAQTHYTGTNAPGTGQNHAFTVGGAVLGIAIELPNTPAEFSHLLLNSGGAASEADHDWSARLSDGSKNAIYLERPELLTGNYGFRVQTPTESAAHIYDATLTINPAGLRSAAMPVSKPPVATVTGTLAPGDWHYFRVELPAAFGGWRLAVSGGTGEADLYVGRDFMPTEAAATKFSAGLAVDTVHFSDVEGAAGTYYVGVNLAAAAATGTSYTLTMTQGSFTQLVWDPGTSHAGTVVKASGTIPGNAAGGDFLLKLTAENVTRGAWRTALKATSGEVNLYLSRGGFPTPVAFEFKSERAGSDGVVLDASQFAPGEEWFFLVRASAGAVWSIVSGEVHMENLGTLAASGVNTVWPVGPEGVRFFQTTVPAATRAWALWLNGANLPITVRKNSVPVPDVAVDLVQNRQMLVVPPYLGSGSDVYFVGVAAAPGTNVVLDSHIQAITPLVFASDTAGVAVSGYGYKTYQVTVPAEQIAWEVEVTPNTGSAADFALRRGEVPNEHENTAFSEVPGTLTDSVTLSPPTLSDGTYYATVYGIGAYTFRIKSGNPVAEPVIFAGNPLLPTPAANPRPNKVGWQYFRFENIPAQLGKLGWEFFLSGQVPGTQLALRRNAVPSKWNFRSGGVAAIAGGHFDYWSTSGFLQRPGHQADIYYVGVYSPAQALDNFTLHIVPIPAPVQVFNGSPTARTGLAPGRWDYFNVTVPAGGLGWDVRLVNVTAGQPILNVRRDLLPEVGGTVPNWSPAISAVWPTSNQWGASSDWTNWPLSPGGADHSGRILAMGLGYPLEPGTYYVGIYNADPANSASYTLQSRGIGSGLAIPVPSLNFSGAGSSVAIPALAPREAAYFSVNVPANTPSWQIKLTPTAGEAMLTLHRGALPSVGSDPQLEKTGNDHYVLLPAHGESFIPAGLYYLAVVSEGVGPTAGNIGLGNIAATLQSKGVLPVASIGAGTAALNATIQTTGTLEGGEVKAYAFSVPAGLRGVEVRIESTAGAPLLGVVAGTVPPRLDGPTDYYGYTGGQSGGGVTTSLTTIANPTPGPYRVLVQARDVGGVFSDAAFTVKVTGVGPVPVAFDDLAGTSNEAPVLGQEANSWRFFTIMVPAGVLGWDLRVAEVVGGAPNIFIRRGALLPDGSPPNWYPYNEDVWPDDYEMAVGADIVPQHSSPFGESEFGRNFSMGVGGSLVAGVTYTVGVYNAHPTGATSYTLRSRGINPVGVATYSIATQTLAFSSVPTAITGLDPRERAYFRVLVPGGQPSWQIKLTPTIGEAALTLFAAELPNAATYPNLAKTGNDHFVILPSHGETTIPGGFYYLAVTSQGVGPAAGNIGTGPIQAILHSKGNLPVTMLPGTLAVGNPVQIPGTLEGGEVKAYAFTVPANVASMEVRLEDVTQGAPLMAVRAGTALPRIDGGVDYYGYTGGQQDGAVDDDLITLANPAPLVPRTYRVLVQARAGALGDFPDATYTLRVVALAPAPLAFDDQIGNANEAIVTGHPPGTWRYFQVNVPSSPLPLGWDLRLTGVTAGEPLLTVRRGSLPDASGTTPGWFVSTDTAWPLHNQWTAGSDWTPWPSSPTGENENGRVLAMGVGQPLMAGQTYSIGVFNAHATVAAAYTLRSRGISAAGSIAYSLRTEPLAFSGPGSADTVTSLAAREAAYYRIVVPANTASWRVRLTPLAGEAMLSLARGFLPNVNSAPQLAKSGNDHYVILPADGDSFIASGAYYLAVISEGVNPGLSGPGQIGNSSADATLESLGVLPTTALPAVSFAYEDTLPGGTYRHYTFTIPPAVDVFELSLDDRIGNPVFALRPGTAVPRIDGGLDFYGYTGGAYGGDVHGNIVTLTAPAPGSYSIAIQARNVGGEIPDAAFTLKAIVRSVGTLNFSPTQNGNGHSNANTLTLADAHSAFYAVAVPATLAGAPVLGWRLNIARTQGSTTVRVHHTLATLRTEGITIAGDSGVIVPPYFTPGSTWYVEVIASGATTYTLTSTPVLLERPLWVMPRDGQPHGTLGLPAGPIFADTGVDPAGAPVPPDGGTDLAQGDFDFYAITVPAESGGLRNGGLLRAMLEAINGNPDLYVRAGAVPTSTHASAGPVGTPLIDYALTAAATTEYGNWVPVAGTAQVELTPGTWYFAVQAAGGSNARYRLRLSVGAVQAIAYDGAALINQTIAGGDWRYYKVTVPAHAPAPWEVAFSQVLGDVTMFVRDTVPPGQAGGVGGIIDWSSDGKNQGPYPSFDLAGTHTFTTPPLRPGHVYYLGFRATGDATFTLNTTQTGSTTLLTDVDFATGTVNAIIAAGTARTFRILVPAAATRWRHTSVHATSLGVQIEQGTLPMAGGPQHWSSEAQASSSLNVALDGWPWVPGQTYYLTVRNYGVSDAPYTLTMGGRTALTEDEDADGLPDAWERSFFPTLATAHGDDDGDDDGVSNILENALGMNPLTPSLIGLPVVTVEGGFLTMTVNKPAGVGGLTYAVEVTGGLIPAAWTSAGTTVVIGTPGVLKVRDNVSIGSAAQRNIRLRVTRP